MSAAKGEATRGGYLKKINRDDLKRMKKDIKELEEKDRVKYSE